MTERPTTYFALAALDDAPAGRFAKPKPRVTGGPPREALPVADWSRDPVPQEPPRDGSGEGLRLGMDVSGVGHARR
jgi:hypothetical protein